MHSANLEIPKSPYTYIQGGTGKFFQIHFDFTSKPSKFKMVPKIKSPWKIFWKSEIHKKSKILFGTNEICFCLKLAKILNYSVEIS